MCLRESLHIVHIRPAFMRLVLIRATWTVHFTATTCVIRSNECSQRPSESNGPCDSCSKLRKHRVVEGIEDCNWHGVPISTSYQWLTVAQLTDALHRKTAEVNKLKLLSLNMAHSLLSRASHLDAHKQFLIAVGQGNINGLHRLVSTARHAGESIYSIVEKCNLVVQGLYRPKSYQE